MGHSICLLSLIILLKILRPFECNNLKMKALLTQFSKSTAFDLKSDNETMYNTLKLDLSFATSTKRSTFSENNTSISKTSTMDTIESTDEREDQQIFIILEKSNRNSVLESWYRVKREGEREDEEYQKSSNSDGNNTSDKNNDNNSTFDENNDNISNENYDTTEEETDDSSSKRSKEESYSQFDHSEVDSTDVKDREKKSTYSQESEEERRLYPAWYQPSFSNRYWSSDEKGSSHHFIKIPVFPGK